MEITFNLEGITRKELVQAISEITGCKARYMRTPTYAYTIGDYTVTRQGSLVWDERTPEADANALKSGLIERGFKPENCSPAEAEDAADKGLDSTDTLCIELPRELLPEAALANLDRIIEAKGNLLRKALGADSLAYELTDEKVRFPWFHLTGEDGETEAYMQLISALADMARNSKRITAKEKEVENEKYAFRCFLLRLGFIGKEYKTARKILLRNMEGNSAWRDGRPEDKTE